MLDELEQLNDVHDEEQEGTPERTRFKTSVIGASVVLGLGLLGLLGWGLMFSGGAIAHDDAAKTESELETQSEARWSLEFDEVSLVAVTEQVIAIRHDQGVSLVDVATGESVATFDDAPDGARVVGADGDIAVFTEDRLWMWGHEDAATSTLSLSDTQVRVLGDMIFAISADHSKISRVMPDATLTDVTLPVEGAVPLAGTRGGDIIWATSGPSVIVTDGSGDKVSDVSLATIGDGAQVHRWLGATFDHTFVMWQSEGGTTLVVHKNSDGKAISAAPIAVDDAVWRISGDQSLAVIDATVVHLVTGSLTQFTTAVIDVVPLQSSFIGVQDGEMIRFDSTQVELLDRSMADGVSAETRSGALIRIDTHDEGQTVSLSGD